MYAFRILRGTFFVCWAMLVVCAAYAGKAADDMPEPRLLPWNLRDHYTFKPNGYELIYGGDNGQWALIKPGLGNLFDKVNASVTLADGKVLEAQLHGVGTTNRKAYTAELGEGVEYIVNIPAKDGISMRHSLSYFKQHPFYVLRFSITNEGTTPIQVAKISTAIFAPDSLKVLSPQATIGQRRIHMHGPCPVYSSDAAPYAMFFNDPANQILFGIGVLANGRADASLRLEPYSGAWTGEAQSVFAPTVRLEPGQSIEGEPVWMSFISSAADLDLYYAHAHINFPKPANPASVPAAWVTVPDGEPLTALQGALSDWSGAVDAALIPGTWEGRPGSLDGGAGWPRDMKNAAAQLRQNAAAVGITVDPLAGADAAGAFAAKSEDGQVWINPADKDGFDHIVTRMRRVSGWGFDFYVVAPSHIPDEVLKHFNLSRGRADALSVDAMIKAAAPAPVFAASRGSIGAERDSWLEAAAATARLSEYNIVTGPVRFDGSKAREIQEETVTAMAFCGAPIEVLPGPTSDAKAAVAQAVSRSGFFARPMDIANTAPKLWQVETMPGSDKSNLTITLVSFEGARPSTPEDLKTYSGTPKKTDNAQAAGYVSQLPANGPGKQQTGTRSGQRRGR